MKGLVLDGDFNSNVWSYLNTSMPSWFPRPHRVWERVYYGDISANAEATRMFAPPFELLLNGDDDTLAHRRMMIAQLRNAISSRRMLALQDSSVCPLSKHEWRQLSSGALFRESVPSCDDMSFYWLQKIFLYGHESIWGKELVASAAAARSKSLTSPLKITWGERPCYK